MNTISKFFTTLLGVFVLTSFMSCSKDSEKDEDVVKFINAKWDILDAHSEIAFLEFTGDGNYIVVKNKPCVISRTVQQGVINGKPSLPFSGLIGRSMLRVSSDSNPSSVHFGKYRIEGSKIILSGLGTVNVISITAKEFSFSLSLQSTGENCDYIAFRNSKTIATSSKNEMFCCTWILNKITLNEYLLPKEYTNSLKEIYGSNWKTSAEKEINSQIAGSKFLFSKSGTYLILYAKENYDADLSEWKWVNMEEKALYYSPNNWQTNFENNIIFINELNKNSLKLQENGFIYELSLSK